MKLFSICDHPLYAVTPRSGPPVGNSWVQCNERDVATVARICIKRAMHLPNRLSLKSALCGDGVLSRNRATVLADDATDFAVNDGAFASLYGRPLLGQHECSIGRRNVRPVLGVN